MKFFQRKELELECFQNPVLIKCAWVQKGKIPFFSLGYSSHKKSLDLCVCAYTCTCACCISTLGPGLGYCWCDLWIVKSPVRIPCFKESDLPPLFFFTGLGQYLQITCFQRKESVYCRNLRVAQGWLRCTISGAVMHPALCFLCLQKGRAKIDPYNCKKCQGCHKWLVCPLSFRRQLTLPFQLTILAVLVKNSWLTIQSLPYSCLCKDY